MKTRIILFLSIVMLSTACKSTKSSSKSENAYRVIVSFASKGEGIDSQALASFESYLITFGNKLDNTIQYDKYTYGREGEVDYCFHCKEMKKSEQKDFVAGLTNLLKTAPLVFVKENAVCSHKQ